MTTMNFMTSRDLLLTSTVLLFLTLLPTSSCLREFPSTSSQGTQMEDKIRLGSTPPNCHNRCNRCSPCTAVQVPSLPSPHVGRSRPQDYDQYNNYKPLGWKCRCGDRFYNP